MCVFVCFCLSKPFPTSLPLPLQPLSREVKARCTQTHPDAFNLSKWVTSVHMFRFLAWTKGKRLAFYFGKRLGLLAFDPEASSSSFQESLQACQCPGFFSPAALMDASPPQDDAVVSSRTCLGHVDAPLPPAGPGTWWGANWKEGHRAGQQATSRDRGLAAWGHLQAWVWAGLHSPREL